MTKIRLTDRGIRALKPRIEGGPLEVMDTVCGNLGVRVQGNSVHPVRTFVLIARFPGARNPTRRRLGRYPEITLEQARDKARDWLAMIRRGIDPSEEEARQRAATERNAANSFEKVAEAYISRHVSKLRGAKNFSREIRGELVEPWRGRPIDTITRQDVVAVIDAIVDRGAPEQARNVFGHLRALLNWAIGRGVYGLETSPCDRIKPKALFGTKRKRDRVLTDDEIRAIWKGARQLGYPFGPLVQLLLLTGQRKSEVSDAEWSEFDLERRVWTIPAPRMKGERAHAVPLSDPVIKILKALPRFPSRHIFSFTFGRTPCQFSSRGKAAIDETMGRYMRAIGRIKGNGRNTTITPWVIHDIRRTMRTRLSGFHQVEDLVRELVISHTKPGLHQVYDLYAYLDEKRQALDLWSKCLDQIVNPPRRGQVIPLVAHR
jgi:integrase